MAKIFIAIALGSGLSKIILDTTEKINDNQQFMFNFGMSILLIISLLLVFDVIQLKKYTNKLKD
ncbi:MAG: hypothetical protein U9R37_02190 [Campylobacterota bacterium]|nr:hypothetical protein [Campylobacterota bacterium]